jgi:hypothetical protein
MIRGNSVTSDVLYSQVFKGKKYIRLPIFNSDAVVMLRGNRNFHLFFFVKGGSLQRQYKISLSRN